MRSVRLNPYILLGSSVRFLLDAREELPIRRRSQRNELGLLTHIERVGKLVEEMGLKVTEQAFSSEMGELQRSFQKAPEDATLTQAQASVLVERMNAVAGVLKYEAISLQAYIVAEKRLPVAKLLSDISGLFGENVYRALPDLTQYDFAQAGKCIAFEAPTAAAFHILRGTEGVLRSYHSSLALSADGNVPLPARSVMCPPELHSEGRMLQLGLRWSSIHSHCRRQWHSFRLVAFDIKRFKSPRGLV